MANSYKKPVMSSMSHTLDASPVAHLTCDHIIAPPGPSTFFPISSNFRIHPLRAAMHSAFDALGAVVSGHCSLKASVRCW
jgi:hypothetical protein